MAQQQQNSTTFPESVLAKTGWKGQIGKRLDGYDLLCNGMGVQMRTLNESLFKVATTMDDNCKQILGALKKDEDDWQKQISKINQDIVDISDCLLWCTQAIERIENTICEKAAITIETTQN